MGFGRAKTAGLAGGHFWGLLQIEWVIFVILRRFRYLMAMRSPIGDR